LTNFFDTSIEFLKGVGPQRAVLFQKELKIFTFGDLIQHYPFRYEDRTNLKTIAQLAPGEMATVIAEVATTKTAKLRGKMGLFEARFHDASRSMLIGKWFHGDYLKQVLVPGVRLALYGKIEAPLIRTNIETAEMVKYVDNCWHALKIGFANEIGNICKSFSIDAHDVMKIFCEDKKLNISPAYLLPGFAFGGSCLRSLRLASAVVVVCARNE